MLTDLVQAYRHLILRIGEGTALPDAMLHIHAGLAVLLLARLVSGRALGSFVPFAFVVAAEAVNETFDYLSYGLIWRHTLLDVVNTLFWPLAITLAVRWRPMIARDRRALGR